MTGPGATPSPPPPGAPTFPAPYPGYVLVPYTVTSRKRRSPGATAAIAILVILVILAGLFVYYQLITCIGCGGNQVAPTGAKLTLGGASASRSASATYENLSVEDASTGLTINSLSFSVQSSEGEILAPPAGSEVQLRETSGLVATFTFSTAAWTGAALTTHVTSEETLSLVWPSTSSTDPLPGDRLIVSGSNGYQGTIDVTLA